MSNAICPNNFQGEREHKWGWCSVTSFSGGRSGQYAECYYCKAEDWAILDKLKSEMPPPDFKPGDTVIYRDEKWRWDVTGSVRLHLVKTTEYEAIVANSYSSTTGGGLLGEFGAPLEWRYSILCKDGDKLFTRSPTAADLIPSDHGGTIAEWKARAPKPKPYKLEDNDTALLEPRLRCIGVEFEISDNDARCGNCSNWYRKGGPRANIHDGIRLGMEWRALVERYQRGHFFSGGGGFWCPTCAHKLLPFWSKAYLKFKLTGEFPMKKYIQSTCDDCHTEVSSYYYRSIGEDLWEVFCRECQYARQPDDLMEGGFGHMLGCSSASIGTLVPGESVSIKL